MKKLKANKSEISFFKNVKGLLDRTTSVLDYYRSYHYGQSSGIMINVKQHDFFDKEDATALIHASNIPKKAKTLVLDEFIEDQGRLDNIYNHVLESQREHLTESLSNQFTIDQTIKDIKEQIINNTIDLISYPSLKEIVKQKRTRNTKLKAVDDFFKEQDQLELAASHLDSDDFGFFGRGGGWFRICKDDKLNEFKYEAEHILDQFSDGSNSTTFDTLYLTEDGYFRSDFEEEIEDFKYNLADYIEYISAIEFLIKHVEEVSKQLNIAVCMADQIEYEINDFLFDNGFKGNYKYDSLDLVNEWKKGSNYFPRTATSAYLRLHNGNVQTSKGLSFDPLIIKNLYLNFKNGIMPTKVKNFTVDSIDQTNIKIGCHTIQINEIESFANSMNW